LGSEKFDRMMRDTTIGRAFPTSRSAHPGTARRPVPNRRREASGRRIP